MTARSVVETERHENLAAFEETFSKLQGIAEEHVIALRRAATTTATRSFYPSADDPLGQAAYTAAGLRGLAEAVVTLQGNASVARKAS